jgi:hypothetical protein
MPLRIPMRRLEYSIKMNLEEIGWGVTGFIWHRIWVLVEAVVNYRVYYILVIF